MCFFFCAVSKHVEVARLFIASHFDNERQRRKTLCDRHIHGYINDVRGKCVCVCVCIRFAEIYVLMICVFIIL